MTTNKREDRLRIPSQTDNLEIIRDLVSKVASKVGFGDEDVGKIESPIKMEGRNMNVILVPSRTKGSKKNN